MAIEKAEAFILKTYNTGEQDKLVVFFSRKNGIIKGVAKGARKFGNRFGSTLEPMSHVRVFYYEKEGKELVTISNCDLLESFFEIQKDLDMSFTVSYFSELIEEFFPSRSDDEVLFRLLLTTLRALKSEIDTNFTAAYFEAWFLKLNGLLPGFKRCKKCRREINNASWLSIKRDGVLCGSCVQQKKDKIPAELIPFLDWVKKNPPVKNMTSPLSSQQIVALRKIFQSIIIFNMEKIPRSLSYFK